MSRIAAGSITYPPEMLPIADADDEAEVVICCGGTACERGDACPHARVITPDQDAMA